MKVHSGKFLNLFVSFIIVHCFCLLLTILSISFSIWCTVIAAISPSTGILCFLIHWGCADNFSSVCFMACWEEFKKVMLLGFLCWMLWKINYLAYIC